MIERIEDRNVSAVEPLVSPRAVKGKFPPTPAVAELVSVTRAAIRDLLHGRDRRRLAVVANATRGELVVVMRTYFEKPRTTVGWKGLINDPHLDGTCHVGKGL